MHPFDAVTEADLRRRRSAKWMHYATDVLPAWVAEMDYPLDEEIRAALTRAIADDDCGYAHAGALPESFSAWAMKEWQWRVEPRDVHLVADVVTGLAEILRAGTKPGDGIVIDTPVYHPFADTIREVGRTVVATPLRQQEDGTFALDLDAIERAYAAGGRAHLLCSPHNPAGLVVPREDLVRVAALAERHGVLVVSDEIHAPLTLAGVTHHPFPMVSEAAARSSIVVTSASKTWNVAGLKAAMMIAQGDEGRRALARLSPALPYHAGHFGVLASCAAFDRGEAWRASVLAILDRNRRDLATLLSAHLPGARYTPPQASYLAWIDCRALGLGDDPARAFLERGKVALSPGPIFGAPGRGFARLNFATTRALLEEAVVRMARAIG